MADKAKRERPTEVERLKGERARIEERLRVCDHAGNSVSDLIRLAEAGDKLSVTMLAMLAVITVDALNSIAKRRPELILPFSRNGVSWPALISRKRAFIRENNELMDTLQLGKGGIYSERKWQPAAATTQAAIGLLINAQSKRTALHLPPLTKRTKRRWFEVSWKDFLDRGIKPEESEKLARLGNSKATKTPKYCKHLFKRTRDANVRAEIKARVWDAFDQLIAGLGKASDSTCGGKRSFVT
jgi:hypothetical protein